jgi:hypothetical protein
MHHRHCRGSCRVPGIDRSHSGRPSAAIQQHRADTSCHHCTRPHGTYCKCFELHSVVYPRDILRTQLLEARSKRCLVHHNHCNRSQWSLRLVRFLLHKWCIVGHRSSIARRMHRNPCAVHWALFQLHTVSKAHHQSFAKTSRQKRHNSHTMCGRCSVDSQHCIGGIGHLMSTSHRHKSRMS